MLDQIIDANHDALILAARILLMILFVMTGWQKLTNFSATRQYMASVSVPMPALAAVVATVMEFGVGIALVVGIFTRPSALVFMAFTLAAALFGHHYWTLRMEDATRLENEINSYKNMSIMGGLPLLAVAGHGKFVLVS